MNQNWKQSSVAYEEWLRAANTKVGDAIESAYLKAGNGGWREDSITTEILSALETFGSPLTWQGYPQTIVWETHKLSGTEEHEHGDIALFVNVCLDDNRHLLGVAYYEAKRQYFDDKGAVTGFRSISKDQLDRFALKSSHDYLFYDYIRAEETEAGTTHAIVTTMPAKFVKSLAYAPLEKKDGKTNTDTSKFQILSREILGYGTLWMDRLGRQLRGYDLSFDEGDIQELKTHLEKSEQNITAINVAVSFQVGLEPTLDDSYLRTLAQDIQSGNTSTRKHRIV